MASKQSKNRILQKIEDLPVEKKVREFIEAVLEYESQKATQRSWFKKPYDELLEKAMKTKEAK